MLNCIVEDAKYLSLKEKSGILDLSFKAAYSRFLTDHSDIPGHESPNLDEIPRANSSKHLSDRLHIDKNGAAKIDDILVSTGASTIEEANIKINDEYADLEVNITPINKTALVRIERRPNQYENLSREDGIRAQSYFSLVNRDEVEIEYKRKPWRKNKDRSNLTMRIYLKGQKEKGYFELVKDDEDNYYSVHFKTGDPDSGETYGSTQQERQILYKNLLDAIPDGMFFSTYGEISEGGMYALNKLGKGFKYIGNRIQSDRDGNKIVVPIFLKISTDINTPMLFNSMFEKLRKLYGIELVPITYKELQGKEWQQIPEAGDTSAFIYNNKIYINTDLADIDAPMHEMTHMLLGSIRFKNPDLYFKLISIADLFSNFNEIARNNPNKTQSDIYEEAFVQETAKYLAGLDSAINLLEDNIKYELHYNMKRLMDSVLMGDYSVKTIDEKQLYKMSLRELITQVNSALLNVDNLSSINDATQHRILANVKSDLMRKNELREEC